MGEYIRKVRYGTVLYEIINKERRKRQILQKDENGVLF